jgi:hypothetical protein
VSWAEADPSTRRRFAFTTTLDGVFRRVTAVLTVTPEAKLVQQPALGPMDDGLSLLYWDNAPEGGKVFVRRLDASGSIAGPPIAVSQGTDRQSFPALTREANGHLWIAWTEKDGAKLSDLFLRSIAGDLKSLTTGARLTRYAPPPRGSATASHVALAMAHGFVNVAYALERGLEHQVFVLRVSMTDPLLSHGGLPSPKEGSDKQPDRYMGQLIPISAGPGQHADPSIACIEAGCFVAWDDQKGGAHVAFYSGTNGEVIWRRDLGPKALNPTIAIAASDLMIAWYDAARLRLARLGRDGVGEPTLIGHASGYQPPPNLIPGAKPKEWIVAWRDFEAGQHEGFVARAECK